MKRPRFTYKPLAWEGQGRCSPQEQRAKCLLTSLSASGTTWAVPQQGCAPPLAASQSLRAAGSLAAIGGGRSGTAGLAGELAIVARFDLRARGPCSPFEARAPR